MNRTLQITNRLLTAVVAALILTLLTKEYIQYRKDMETLGPRKYGNRLHNDRYKTMSVATYNYTDHDIYGVFILPEDKSNLDYATNARGSPAAPIKKKDWDWRAQEDAISWDYRWKTPKRFKIWWERMVDKELYQANTAPYDEYTSKATQPGLAWCEGFITLNRPPSRIEHAYIVLHFFPDGSVEGDINGEPRVQISKHHELPKLINRACIKQIPNPFYGRKKPVRFN